MSRYWQRRAIKKGYAEARVGRGARNASKVSEAAAKAAKKSGEGASKTSKFVAEHKSVLLWVGAIGMIILIFSTLLSSCSMMMGALPSSEVVLTYPCADAELLSAEAQYSALEEALQEYLDTYEETHDYSEYHYALDEIEHDPYVLMSMLTALKGGAWTADEVGDLLQSIFNQQYSLNESVTTKTRYRAETRVGHSTATDEATGATFEKPYTYTVQLPYEYTICTVSLKNENLSHLPILMMGETQLSMYAAYMSVLGNRPDLFPESPYIGKYYGEHEQYEIPAEYLEDERFAAVIEEAEKYIGFPYVWGGYNPNTSFDCSGFVCWALNHSDAGYSVGDLNAEGLRSICTYVSPQNAQPGDLIFLEKTYDASGASHVGIYVGNNRVLHCGDPIGYASIDNDFWRAHFLQFGRLP